MSGEKSAEESRKKDGDILQSGKESRSEESVAPKRKDNRLKVVGIVAGVIVVLGIAGFVWHEQPSFCSAICHTPMDGYLQTYEAKLGQSATDKWGNTVANASGMMASVHREKAGSTCLSCHQPVMSEQVTEGMEWVSGNYYAPLSERSLTDLVQARGVNSQQFCLNSDCHNMTYDDLAQATSNMTYNPHETHYDGLECSDCHKAHRASVYYCTKCHSDAADEMPEGWITYSESQELEQKHSAQE